jgi:hypothetical protein
MVIKHLQHTKGFIHPGTGFNRHAVSKKQILWSFAYTPYNNEKPGIKIMAGWR